MNTHGNLSTMMFVAILAVPSAGLSQSVSPPPADSAAVDSAPPQSKMQKLSGLFGKAKKVAANKNVQSVAKGVACTAVPGAAVAGAAGKGPCNASAVATLLQNGTVKGAVSGAANGAVAGALGQNATAAALVGDAANAKAAVGALGGLKNAAKTTAATAIMGTGSGGTTAAQAAAILGNAGAVNSARNAAGNAKNGAAMAKSVAGMTGGGKSTAGAKGLAAATGMSNEAAVAAIEQMMKDAGTAINSTNQPISKAAPASSGKKTAPASAGSPPPVSVNANYDFVPGDRTLFFLDYSDDKVGNFPKKLKFVEGNMEIVEAGTTRLMRITTPSVLTIPLGETLPQKFTVEIDVINRPSIDGWTFQLRGGLPVASGDLSTTAIDWGSEGVAVLGGGGGEVKLSADDATRERYRGKPVQLRVFGDGDYIKVYLDQRRLANIPNAQFARMKTLMLRIDARSEENPAFIGKIRVAESK